VKAVLLQGVLLEVDGLLKQATRKPLAG